MVEMCVSGCVRACVSVSACLYVCVCLSMWVRACVCFGWLILRLEQHKTEIFVHVYIELWLGNFNCVIF